MSEKFTPLALGSLPVTASDQVIRSDAAAPASAGPFRSLPSRTSDPVPASDACAQPAVTLQRNAAGVVTSIRVQCGCGRVTELNCVY